VILYYTNDKRTCLHTINMLPRRTAQQVPARRTGITTGFNTGKKLPHTALGGCNQPHEAVIFATYLQNIRTLPCKMANNTRAHLELCKSRGQTQWYARA